MAIRNGSSVRAEIRTLPTCSLEEFQRDPRDNSLIRHLLRQAVNQNAVFRGNLTRAVEAASRENPRYSGQQSFTITGSAGAQIGDRGDMINRSRVATRGGTYHEGDIRHAGIG